MQCECIDKDAHNWIEGCLEEGLWKDPVTEERKGLRCEMTYKPHLFGFHVKRIRVNVNLLIHLWFRVPKIFWTRNSVVTYSMKIRSGTWTIWKQWSVDTFLIVSHLRFLVVDYPVFIKLWSWPNVVRHIWIFIFPVIYTSCYQRKSTWNPWALLPTQRSVRKGQRRLSHCRLQRFDFWDFTDRTSHILTSFLTCLSFPILCFCKIHTECPKPHWFNVVRDIKFGGKWGF